MVQEDGGRTALTFDDGVSAGGAQERLRAVLDDAPQGVLVRTESEMLYVNHALAQIHGYDTVDEFLKTGTYTVHIHPLDQLLVTARARARVTNQQAPQQYEFRFLRRDGSIGWMECNATRAIWDDQPTSLSWLTDISARKRAVEALRRSERLFFKVFQENPDIVTLSTVEEGRYVDVNEAFLKLSGRPRSEVIGRTVFELGVWSNHDLRSRVIDKLRRDGRVQEVVTLTLSEDGTPREYLFSAERFQFEDRDLLLTVCHDITEQRRKEKLRSHSQKLEALGTLAGGIAHDLNNTLVPILALTKLTARQLPEGSRGHRNLMTVLSASERARDLVKQILAFSREEKAERTHLDFAALLRDAMEMLRASVPATIKFEVDIAPAAMLSGNASQLHQVIINLVGNASQAIGAKIGTISVSLSAGGTCPRVDVAEALEWIRLAVADSGCGMEEVTLRRIFEPFFTTKSVGEGTGLGLSVAHGIITSHGGHVDVESVPGRGSTFTVYLPASGSAVGCRDASAGVAVA
jgi:two-component system cell cycle sensor histidine kinase/response regulator CckA